MAAAAAAAAAPTGGTAAAAREGDEFEAVAEALSREVFTTYRCTSSALTANARPHPGGLAGPLGLPGRGGLWAPPPPWSHAHLPCLGESCGDGSACPVVPWPPDFHSSQPATSAAAAVTEILPALHLCFAPPPPTPGDTAEPSSLSAIPLPPTSYPLLEALAPEVLAAGKLSQLQLEGILYACAKHLTWLPSGEREWVPSASLGRRSREPGCCCRRCLRGLHPSGL